MNPTASQSTKRLALLSVSEKTGIVPFAQRLLRAGCAIVSTGGTAQTLRIAGIAVREVSELTGFAEMLGGRVKSLHPAVHAGILARRDDPQHLVQLRSAGIEPIAVVAVNLYPFGRTVADPDATFEAAIEQIDIGGVALLRSAAKNHRDVLVASDPSDYEAVANAIEDSDADLPQLRLRLAARAFRLTAEYDRAIADYLERAGGESQAQHFPERCEIAWPLRSSLRYGENPHQRAALYADPIATGATIVGATFLHGKELSYNNILDADAALGAVLDLNVLGRAAAVVVKHSNPCGIALGDTLLAALQRARACDPESAFGGIVALNRTVDLPTAEELSSFFLEVVVAPAFDDDALALLRQKKNLRLLATGTLIPPPPATLYRSVAGGLLAGTSDTEPIPPPPWRTVTRRIPTPEDLAALRFAWLCAKWVKSNAIVFTDADSTIGIGAGQMSRADSTRLAAMKARRPVAGCYLASDAFFPFRDAIDAAAAHGVAAIVQPGGSIRDEETIAAADEHGIAMVFTGLRHFRH